MQTTSNHISATLPIQATSTAKDKRKCGEQGKEKRQNKINNLKKKSALTASEEHSFKMEIIQALVGGGGE